MKVVLIDYGMGNLFSVSRSFEYMGAGVILSSDPVQIQSADRVVLPGVGAFGDGMRELHQRGLVEALRDYAQSGRPFLGICLGMQMMMDFSLEFGRTEGLGLLPGGVEPIANTSEDGRPLKVPHIGWNELKASGAGWSGTPLSRSQAGSSVYFVHSFHAKPTHEENRLAYVEYGGHEITAAVGRGKVFGCQFHPEKSSKDGLMMVETFLGV